VDTRFQEHDATPSSGELRFVVYLGSIVAISGPSLKQSESEQSIGYAPSSIEPRWQRSWREARSFAAPALQDERRPAYVFADCPIASEQGPWGQVRGITIADVCARFHRMRGRAVLFSVGFDTFMPLVEIEAQRSGFSPGEWALRRCERMQSQLEKLGCSCDWERAFVSSDPENYRWTQWLFLAMLERDLVYELDGEWVMRRERLLGDAEQRLEALTGEDAAAIESQSAALGRVDGVELCASTFGGDDFTVFTPYVDGIAETKFIALSPAHPQVDQLTRDPAVAEQVAAMRDAARGSSGEDAGEMPLVVTSALATVPGVNGMLPVVVTPLVDARFGPTAVLGLPELDATDHVIASRLPRPAGVAWKTSSSKSTPPCPAARYRVHDLVISRPGAWGAPIPLVRCGVCGAVPAPLDDLPVRVSNDSSLGESEGEPGNGGLHTCVCPRCGGPARRETGVIDGWLDRMWMWLAPCVPATNRPTATMSDPERAHWLPVEQIVTYTDAAAGMLERLMLAEMMRDLDTLPAAAGEPFSRVLMHQTVGMEIANGEGDDSAVGADALTKLDELIERVGGDTLRLAILYAAAPTRPFRWTHMPLRHCQRFLQGLYDYAEPRLREWACHTDRKEARIDASEKLRRRLAHWCAVACERVTLQIEQLALQRAAHNLMLLLTRIMDFESRVLEWRGDPEALDREATVAALLLLTRLVAPLTPHLAEELWSVAGNESSVTEASWPTPSRRLARD
jgi:leucyl-tRNA synthetase